MSRHTVSSLYLCTKYETWKLKTLRVRVQTGTDGKQHHGCHGNHFRCRTYVATHRLHSLYICTKYESWKLWELKCGQERMENSILVAMETTLDDERMSRHTVSTLCTYVPNMKRESWKLWELECGQEWTDGRTDGQTDRQTDGRTDDT